MANAEGCWEFSYFKGHNFFFVDASSELATIFRYPIKVKLEKVAFNIFVAIIHLICS